MTEPVERHWEPDAVRIAGLYVVVALLWIVVSDEVVEALVPFEAVHFVQTAKGGAFVLVTGALLVLLVTRSVRACRREREERLAAEQRIADLVAAVPHGVTECDAGGRIVFANAGMHRMLGYPVGTLEGTLLPDLAWDAAQRSALLRKLQLVVREESPPAGYDAIYRRADGEPLHAQVDWSYRRDEAGRICGFVSVITDIGARLRMETELRESRERYFRLVEEAPVGIGIHADYSVRYVNPEGARLFGASREELTGRSLQSLLVPELWPQTRALAERLYAGTLQRVPFAETRVVRADGSEMELQFSSSAILHEGRPASQVVFTDISGRKQTERALAASRDRLAQTVAELEGLYHTAPVGLAFLDQELRFRRCNERLAEINGAAAEAHPGRTVRQMVPGMADALEPLCRSVLDTGEPVLGRLISGPVPDTGGDTRDFMVSYYPVKGEDGRVLGLNCAVMDVSERIRTERRLRESAEQLAANSRRLERANADLAQFNYVVAHDLKAPLRAVSHLTSWLEEDLKSRLDDSTREQMRLLRQRVARMDALINALLEYARTGEEEEGRTEVVDTAALATEAAASHPRRGDFDLHIAPGMPTLATSRGHLWRVFANLIANAIEHHDRTHGSIQVDAHAIDGEWLFRVCDDGPGVPKRYRKQVFEIFQTLGDDHSTERTGIGLATVKKLVESHGGRIWMESAKPRGAAVHFTWPAPEPPR